MLNPMYYNVSLGENGSSGYRIMNLTKCYASKTTYNKRAVTKTRNGMERNGAERFVIFRLLTKSFDLGLGIPKSKFLGFRESYCMASGRRFRKRTEWNSPFCSGF